MLSRLKKVLIKGILLIISAVLQALPFNFPDLFWVAYFGLVPLFFYLEKVSSKREAFLGGCFAGFLFNVQAHYWMVSATWFCALLGCLIFSGWLGFFCLFSYVNQKQFRASFLAIPAFWVLLEYGKAHFSALAFPWNLLSHSQAPFLAMVQIADLTGAYGISFLLVMVNLAAYLLFKRAVTLRSPQNSSSGYAKHSGFFVAVTLLFLIANLWYGLASMQTKEDAQPTSTVRIALIQPNILIKDNDTEKAKGPAWKTLERLSRAAAADNPDLIVWPETAFPGYWFSESGYETQTQKLMEELAIPFLIGAMTLPTKNSVLLFDDEAHLRAQYDKMNLVPFDEYDPTGGWMTKVLKVRGREIGDMIAGTEMTVFEMLSKRGGNGAYRFATSICFEDAFQDFMRKFAKAPIHFLVNITNDGMFDGTTEPQQHLNSAILRAVEHRIPLVRVANTGVSGLIDPYGKMTGIVQDTAGNTNVEGYSIVQVPLSGERKHTFYTRYGDWFVFVCMVYLGGMVLLRFRWLRKAADG